MELLSFYVTCLKIRLRVGVHSVDGHASRRQVPLAGHIRASPVKYPPAEMQRQDC